MAEAAASPAGSSPSVDVLATIRYLGGRLLRSRVLLAYVVVAIAASALRGANGIAQSVVSYLFLLPLYTLIIYLWTRDEPTAADEARAESTGGKRRDLTLVALLFAVNVAGVVYFWIGALPVQLLDATRAALLGLGWNAELARTAANAVPSALLTLLPALVVIVLLGYRPAQVGLLPRHLGLGLVLIGIGIALAGLVQLAFGQGTTLFRVLGTDGLGGLPLVLAIFLAQMLVNGLQEELSFRGGMLGRLVRWLPNPHHALVLVAVLFVAMHIPSYLARGSASPMSLAASVLAPQPTGLIWGYLYYRTRSIWPGVLWHTSFTTLGALFF